jgi:spermidine synthase
VTERVPATHRTFPGRPGVPGPARAASWSSLRLVGVLFFFSGAAGLVYELTWVRLFSVVFGSSTHAIAVVLALFMLGLALGALLLGRLSDRWREPLLLYGVIELAIAGSGAMVPRLVRAAEPAIALLYQSGIPPLPRLTALRLVLATVTMIVPTALMGATLPVIGKHVIRRTQDIGEKISLLYGLNTLGAVLGCSLGGFYLIRVFGVTTSSYLASGVNATIGLVAILAWRHEHRWLALLRDDRVARSVGPGPRPREAGRPPGAAGDPHSGRLRLAVLGALFVSGFAALSYQILWSRMLGFVLQLGTSTYAFTIVLTVFLAGLGIGGLVHAWWAREIDDPVGVFGLLQVLVAASVLGGVLLLAPTDATRFVEDFWLEGFYRAGSLILPPAVLMGISFPLACRIVSGSPQTLGGTVGAAYAINTAGAVLGPLFTGFLFIPLVGTEGTLKVAASAGVLTGLALIMLGPGRSGLGRVRLPLVGATLLALALVDVSSTQLLLRWFNPRRDPVVYFWEGASGSLLATRLGDGIHLVIGGSVGAGSTPPYQRTDELLAYIPLLLHPAPRDVAVVGFGTGRTAGLYGEHPSVRRVDVVEIAQGAFDAGRDVFASFNRGVLANPKVRPVLDDGFNFMKYAPGRYDVVSIDPFTPRDPGSARLYTDDFLRSVKERLNEAGIVVMWAYPPRVRTSSFRLALKTFQAVFPWATVWTSPVDQMVLFVGAPRALRFDAADLADRLAARPPQDRYPYHLEGVDDFVRRLWLDESAVRDVVASETRAVFTVDRPNLEFVYLTDRSRAVDPRGRRPGKVAGPPGRAKQRAMRSHATGRALDLPFELRLPAQEIRLDAPHDE